MQSLPQLFKTSNSNSSDKSVYPHGSIKVKVLSLLGNDLITSEVTTMLLKVGSIHNFLYTGCFCIFVFKSLIKTNSFS